MREVFRTNAHCRHPHSILFFPKEGKDALFRAAKEGDIEAVRRQLTGHVSVNSQDKVSHRMSCDITPTLAFCFIN